MFKLLRMGSDTIHPHDFFVHRPGGYKWYLLLLVKTPALFYLEDEPITVQPDSLIVFDKEIPHRYEAIGPSYINDWIHFDLNAASLSQLQIQLNTPLALPDGHYLDHLIATLTQEFYSSNPYRELTMEHLMHLFFLKAREYSLTLYGNSTLDSQLIQLRSHIYSNPQYDWSIAMMAQRLNISNGHLQAIYKERFNTSCMADVIEARILHAKELLISTDHSVHDIALLCGYRTDLHFMRQFKKKTARTPSEYRVNP